MIAQPCPDCGTLMQSHEMHDDEGRYMGWLCPACGQTWSDEQIQLVYFLMGIVESEDKTDG